MVLTAKFVRKQMVLLKSMLESSSLESARRGQDEVGKLLAATHRRETEIHEVAFSRFSGAWIIPREELRSGVILYLHGGGYTCGDLAYAEGFGSVLAAECGIRVFAAAYRLAPEDRYPAAVDDVLEAYRYLLDHGFPAEKIVLCGESAGGGLIYALCYRLKKSHMPLPCGLIGISPWTDLTLSGTSFDYNRENDPSMTKDLLEFYAGCYADDRFDPCVSPLFADLSGFPPSLLFAGGDEVLLEDAKRLHTRLRENGCRSRLIVAPGMWHAYVLYCLKENEGDFTAINAFLGSVSLGPKKLRWMKLDNAAKIYPAAKRKNWSNVFRVSVTLTEPVDRETLKSALDVTVRRFPSMAVRVVRGFFWYYLEEIPKAPEVSMDKSCPLARMPFDDIRKCAFRVLYYRNRIAVEFFHAVTDGNGGLVFLKTLAAEYLTQKYQVEIPCTDGVLSRTEEPSGEEMEDSFFKYSGDVSASRREPNAYRISGTPERDGFLDVVTMMLDERTVKEKAASYGVKVTAFLTAVMMKAILDQQKEQEPRRRRRKPVRVLVPVNLRPLFGSRTLRNFVLYITPGIDPKMGDYTMEELCSAAHYQLGAELTVKQMQAKFTANVSSERAWLLRLMPLAVKNLAMKAVYNMIGEKKSCLCLSNLGAVRLPEEMQRYVTRMDFMPGVQAQLPNNCGVLSYGGTVYLNFIRNIREPALESHFFEVLKQLGIPVKVESNQR